MYQLTVTFSVSAVGEFLQIQVIYGGKRNQVCRNSTSQINLQCRSRKITGPIPQNSRSFSWILYFRTWKKLKSKNVSQKNSILWW